MPRIQLGNGARLAVPLDGTVMKQPDHDAVLCPLCGTPVTPLSGGAIPSHACRVGDGMRPCAAGAEPGVGFRRTWAKEASKEKKGK